MQGGLVYSRRAPLDWGSVLLNQLNVWFWRAIATGAYAIYVYQNTVRPMLLGAMLYLVTAALVFLALSILGVG